MLSIIKESFKLTNRYIILATPLILFSLLSTLYLVFSATGNNLNIIIGFILLFLMFGAFLAGWLNMVTVCINNPDDENPNKLLSEFPAGVGEYFLPALGMLVNILIVGTVLFFISYYIGMKLIGDIGISTNDFANSFASVESIKTFLGGLTEVQLKKLNAWNLLLFLTMSFTYFVIMFYSPSLFFKEKNPYKAFYIGLKDLFSRKFFKNLALFLTVFGMYFVVSIFVTASGQNPILYFLFTLVNFYFMTFAVVYIYNFYYNNYVRIGANIDTRV